MSSASKREYLLAIRDRYQSGSKRTKRNMLDEFCRVCGYNRKYAIRLLNARLRPERDPYRQRPGRQPKYQHPDLNNALLALWKAGNLPCGKRLKAMIPLWLPHYGKTLADDVQQLLMTIAPATIDRLLAPLRTRYSKVWQPQNLGRSSRNTSPSRPTNGMNAFQGFSKPIPLHTAVPQWPECLPIHSIWSILPQRGLNNEPLGAKAKVAFSTQSPALSRCCRSPFGALTVTMARSLSTGHC
jgi:hypothetical protein